MDQPKRGFKEGEFAARQFGAEFQANPGSSRQEYIESAAWYYGKESFRELDDKEKESCRENFQAGIRAEKAAQ